MDPGALFRARTLPNGEWDDLGVIGMGGVIQRGWDRLQGACFAGCVRQGRRPSSRTFGLWTQPCGLCGQIALTIGRQWPRLWGAVNRLAEAGQGVCSKIRPKCTGADTCDSGRRAPQQPTRQNGPLQKISARPEPLGIVPIDKGGKSRESPGSGAVPVDAMLTSTNGLARMVATDRLPSSIAPNLFRHRKSIFGFTRPLYTNKRLPVQLERRLLS